MPLVHMHKTLVIDHFVDFTMAIITAKTMTFVWWLMGLSDVAMHILGDYAAW